MSADPARQGFADQRRAALRASLLELSGGCEMLTAAQLANALSVRTPWVYEHAVDLGAIRLGHGSRPPVRFHVDSVLDALLGAQDERPARRLSAPKPRPVPADGLLPVNDRARAGLPGRGGA